MRLSLTVLFMTMTSVFAQEVKTVNYGDQRYEVELSKAFGHDGEFQHIHIEEKENLFNLIEKMVRSEEVTCAKKRSKGLPTSPPSSVNLAFATYEGFTACEDVTRQFVQVSVNDKSMFLIHQDEFDKIMSIYLNGKHLAVCQNFLYNIEMTEYPSIVFEVASD